MSLACPVSVGMICSALVCMCASVSGGWEGGLGLACMMHGFLFCARSVTSPTRTLSCSVF